MGPLSGFLILVGILLVAIGIIVQKFWPHKRGNIEFWFFDFETSEWFSLMFSGMFTMAIGIFLGVMVPL